MNQDKHTIDEMIRLGENATEKIDQARRDTAQALESAASTVRSTAIHGKDAIENLAEGAASRLEATANQVRNFHPFSSLRGVMGRSPGIVLGVGIVAGFMTAYSLRRLGTACGTE
jgi:hypothetical protein